MQFIFSKKHCTGIMENGFRKRSEWRQKTLAWPFGNPAQKCRSECQQWRWRCRVAVAFKMLFREAKWSGVVGKI